MNLYSQKQSLLKSNRVDFHFANAKQQPEETKELSQHSLSSERQNLI